MLICFWLDLNRLYPWEPERIRPWQTMPEGRHSYVLVPSGERSALPSCKPHCTWRYSRWICERVGTKQGTSGQILARMGRRVCQFLFLNLFNCYNKHFRVAVTSASKRVSERTFHAEMFMLNVHCLATLPYLAEVNFQLFLRKIQPTLYMSIANPSRGWGNSGGQVVSPRHVG